MIVETPSLFKVDDSKVMTLFGGVKDDFKTQSTKISNVQEQVQAVDSAVDEMKYKVKSTVSAFDDLKKKVAEATKRSDHDSQKIKGLEKLMNSLFDDMMKMEDRVDENR